MTQISRQKMKTQIVKINDSDIVLFTDLITIYKYNPRDDGIKIVCKDFLLLFKKQFSHKISDVYTAKISKILNIDQKKHVESGINLSFTEWIDKFTPF